MTFDIALLLVGGALLFYGGDWLVDGAKAIADRLRVSPMLVAIVLMGFGTSAPELFLSVDAVLADRHAIAVGNVVGSNIANLLLVLALTAVLSPVAVAQGTLRTDGAAMLLATVAFAFVAVDGLITLLDGAILILGMIAYLVLRCRTDCGCDDTGLPLPVMKSSLLVGAGIVALPSGAHAFVEGAAGLAASIGVSEAVIGMTVVAIGTSLPELAACVVAALKRQADMALGNILGSNVFNSTIVIGAAAFAGPVEVAGVFIDRGLWIMIAATVVTLVLLRTDRQLDRREGMAMLAAYLALVLTLP